MPLTFEEIAEIIKLIDQSSCDEFVVEIGDLKLAVRRKSADATQNSPKLTSHGPARPKPIRAASPQKKTAPGAPEVEKNATESASAAATVAKRADGLTEVRSPMSGIFYRKASPEAEPYASVGTHVNKGDPLCLVEVMKLFTTIYAEQSGRIAEITAEDGQLVEHDQLLFLIEPS